MDESRSGLRVGAPLAREHSPRQMNVAFEQHTGAECTGVLDLVERRGHRHHDRDRNAKAAAMIGDALGMIASRSGDHAGFFLLIRQASQLVERAALFERAGELKILELHPDFGAGNL